MADEAVKKKRKLNRSTPWAKLAREIQSINPLLSAKEVDQQAWTFWFTAACPITSGLIKDHVDAFNEMYEQSSGKFVLDEEDDPEKE